MVCRRKGDLRKCVPIYAVGAVLIFCGLPLMITGIAGQFASADLVGYIGGICIFFGLGFFLVWHVFTIENVEKNMPVLEYDPSLKNIQDVVEKSKALELSESSVPKTDIVAFSNLAYETDKSVDTEVSQDDPKNRFSSEISETASTNGRTNLNDRYVCDDKSQRKSDNDFIVSEEASSTVSERSNFQHNETTLTTLANDFSETSGGNSRNSTPLEIV